MPFDPRQRTSREPTGEDRAVARSELPRLVDFCNVKSNQSRPWRHYNRCRECPIRQHNLGDSINLRPLLRASSASLVHWEHGIAIAEPAAADIDSLDVRQSKYWRNADDHQKDLERSFAGCDAGARGLSARHGQRRIVRIGRIFVGRQKRWLIRIIVCLRTRGEHEENTSFDGGDFCVADWNPRTESNCRNQPGTGKPRS